MLFYKHIVHIVFTLFYKHIVHIVCFIKNYVNYVDYVFQTHVSIRAAVFLWEQAIRNPKSPLRNR